MIIRLLRDVRVRAALGLGAALAVGVTGTYASWTDSVPVSGISMTTGKLDLKINGQDSLATYAGLTMSNMVPGNSAAAVLTVSNSGTIPLTYFATATASGTLGSALAVKVTGDSSTSGSAPTASCAGQALSGSGSTFTGGLVGSSSAPRSLAGSASETLCIQATLPAAADNSLQGQSTSVTLTFTAAQVTS